MPKVEKRIPARQLRALLRRARDIRRRLALAKAAPVELHGGGLVRVPRHLRCCGCQRWLVKGTGAERAPYGYLCSGCRAPEPPENVRLVAAFDALASGAREYP